MRIPLIIISILTAQLALAQVNIKKEKLQDIEDVHEWMSSLHSGTIKWLDEPNSEVEAVQYRLGIGISEIYHTMILERMTFGKEGCCKQITDIWKLDIWDASLRYEISPEAPIEFTKWLGFQKFRIAISGKTYLVDFSGEDWTLEPE